jgi:hypothetical protein
LNLDTTLRVSVSGPNAEAWRQSLIEQGVRAARMETGGVEGSGLHIKLRRLLYPANTRGVFAYSFC